MKKLFLSFVVVILLAGCGASAEEVKATKVLAVCDEANSAMRSLTLDDIVPGYSADWSQIQTTYSGIKSKLQTLSAQLTELDETQLARDFSTISKAAGSIEATASFVTVVGGNAAYAGDNVLRSEWLSAVNKLTDDPALRSDRTFVGCKSS
jgi:uncharacterized lipoprotein YmbA